MGNVISSVKSTLLRIGDVYCEHSKRLNSYWYECPSYPLVENIINGVILVPSKCLVTLPIAVVKIPQKFPLQTFTVIYSYYVLRTVGVKSYIMIITGTGACTVVTILLIKYLVFMNKNTNWSNYYAARNNYIRNNTFRYIGDQPGVYRYGMNMPIPHEYLRVPLTWNNLNETRITF